MDSSSNGVDSNNKISDEVDNDNSNNNKMQNHHHPPPSSGGPRAVSRSAMVKAVVASESLEREPENPHHVDKPVKNVCLVDTPQIFPTGNAMTTRAVIGKIKHEYLRSRASKCLSLSSSFSHGYSTLSSIEILVLISWILHPWIFFNKVYTFDLFLSGNGEFLAVSVV